MIWRMAPRRPETTTLTSSASSARETRSPLVLGLATVCANNAIKCLMGTFIMATIDILVSIGYATLIKDPRTRLFDRKATLADHEASLCHLVLPCRAVVPSRG